ncbi:single-stranded DNA-binding protein [Bacillus solitudinis]|uniref:single-stranded DNA-binding protein n=1 Tax=Bacillus solitudinis TaxID=2014074 RepID=UPI000C2393AA|nr:single-stranded DNA-binding protein [Bacillus solitudinis]
MLNRVVLVGRLTKDPELRYTPNGVAVGNFTLAVNRIRKQENGPDADFINCVVWQKPAENVANYLKKGSLAGIDGRIQTRSYDNNEGKRVFITEVVAETVQFLEPKNSGNQQQSGSQGQQKQNQSGFNSDPFANDGQPIDINDDDLPF